MRGNLRSLLLGGALIGAVVSGCNRATWQYQHRASSYQPPERATLYVSITDQVAEADTYGAVATLVDAVERDLRERGIETKLVVADGEPPPVPRVELQILKSDSGSVAARALVGMGAGAATLVVDCFVYPDDSGKPTFKGRVEGVMAGGSFDTGDPRKAAAYAGEAIAEAIASRD